MLKKMARHWGAVGLAVILVGCGESSQEAFERGYQEGYDDGQYEVCRELAAIAPSLKESLDSSRGF